MKSRGVPNPDLRYSKTNPLLPLVTVVQSGRADIAGILDLLTIERLSRVGPKFPISKIISTTAQFRDRPEKGAKHAFLQLVLTVNLSPGEFT